MKTHDKIAQLEQEIKDKQRELVELKKAQWPPIDGQKVYVVFGNKHLEYIYTGGINDKLLVIARIIVKSSEERDLREKWILLDADIRKYLKKIEWEYPEFVSYAFNGRGNTLLSLEAVIAKFTEEKICFWLDNI